MASRKSRFLDYLIYLAPFAVVFVVFQYFSLERLPSQGFAATATNLSGVFTGNFVYDSDWNTPFLFVSTALVAFGALGLASKKRILAYGFLTIIVGSAMIADWLVFLTPYVKPLYCLNCQVSGMSAVASSSVGAAAAVSLAYLGFSLAEARREARRHDADLTVIRRGLMVPITLLMGAVVTLILFSLSALTLESAATEFVHAASLLLGLTFMAGLVLVVAKIRDATISLAGSRKLFIAIVGFTVLVVGLTSQVYPTQYQTYRQWGWGGYVAFGTVNGSVSAVTGEWIVPQVNCSAMDRGAVLFWVGMDGFRSSPVEQGGTRADCIAGHAVYSAWHEFWPDQPDTVNFTTLHISPGNLVKASVSYVGGLYNITVNDLSTHRFASYIGAYDKGDRLDAEWIVEAPEFRNYTRLALPEFGQVRFNESYATIDRGNDSIGSAVNGTVLFYCTGDHYRLVPSALEPGWTSFEVFSVSLGGCG